MEVNRILRAIVALILIAGREATFSSQTILTCGKTSTTKTTVMQSPTSNVPPDCTYKIRAQNAKVCQLRIEFTTNLEGPQVGFTGYPICVQGVMSISYEGFNFDMCGVNANQHIYVPFHPKTRTSIPMQIAQIRIKTVSQGTWHIVATQLECGSGSATEGQLAPTGCLQYFTEATGVIESFNYNNGSGPYLPNMDYAICFRRSINANAIRFQTEFFHLSIENIEGDECIAYTDTKGYDTDCHSRVPTVGRRGDYLEFEDGVKESALLIYASKFCGQSLERNAVVVANHVGPFMVKFHSDDIYHKNESPELGFRFSFNVI